MFWINCVIVGLPEGTVSAAKALAAALDELVVVAGVDIGFP
jgi:hypothetical protein